MAPFLIYFERDYCGETLFDVIKPSEKVRI